jgi:tellurite resistance protein TerC
MEWVLYVFGAILVYSGWKMLKGKEIEVDPERNIVIRLARRVFPVSTGYSGRNFFTHQGGRLMATPLFLVLLTVETTDVVFAVDSIPAVFGVTRDPFIVYSSNVFAILGLRALYFLLAGAMVSFYYLSHGLSSVLIFIGMKMLLADFIHVPTGISLLVVSTLLTVSVAMSLVRNRRMRSSLPP